MTLTAIHDIGLARLADEAGDSVLCGELWPESAGCSPRTHAFWRPGHAPRGGSRTAVPALVTVACGRDPNLAPEAAAALGRIGERLRPSELAAREVLNVDLRGALSALTTARGQAKALRSDIAQRIDSLVADLKAVLGEKPE